MLRRRAPEDNTVLIDMALGMEKADSYGSISQVTLHHQGLGNRRPSTALQLPALGFRPWSKVDTGGSLCFTPRPE